MGGFEIDNIAAILLPCEDAGHVFHNADADFPALYILHHPYIGGAVKPIGMLGDAKVF